MSRCLLASIKNPFKITTRILESARLKIFIPAEQDVGEARFADAGAAEDNDAGAREPRLVRNWNVIFRISSAGKDSEETHFWFENKKEMQTCHSGWARVPTNCDKNKIFKKIQFWTHFLAKGKLRLYFDFDIMFFLSQFWIRTCTSYVGSL